MSVRIKQLIAVACGVVCGSLVAASTADAEKYRREWVGLTTSGNFVWYDRAVPSDNWLNHVDIQRVHVHGYDGDPYYPAKAKACALSHASSTAYCDSEVANGTYPSSGTGHYQLNLYRSTSHLDFWTSTYQNWFPYLSVQAPWPPGYSASTWRGWWVIDTP